MLTNRLAVAAARDIAASVGVEGVATESGPHGSQYRHPETNLFHRHDGPAVFVEGDEETGQHAWENWYAAGHRHRLDGPAQSSVNGQSWWVNGVRHRLDGPAFVVANPAGDDAPAVREWWVNGFEVNAYRDREWLSQLYDEGKLDELETVLTLWRPGGPSAFELSQAVRAAAA